MFGIKLVLSVSVLAGMLMKCLACMFIVCLFGLCSMPVRIAAWWFRPLQNKISLLFFLLSLSLSGTSFRSTRTMVIDPEPRKSSLRQWNLPNLKLSIDFSCRNFLCGSQATLAYFLRWVWSVPCRQEFLLLEDTMTRSFWESQGFSRLHCRSRQLACPSADYLWYWLWPTRTKYD